MVAYQRTSLLWNQVQKYANLAERYVHEVVKRYVAVASIGERGSSPNHVLKKGLCLVN